MHGFRIIIWLVCFARVFSCEVGRFKFGNSCYDFVKPDQSLPWMEALKACQDTGGSLVSFETESEQDAVREYRYTQHTQEKFYIGLYSQGVNAMWTSGGRLRWQRWSPNSPPQGDSCEGTVLDTKGNNWLRVMCTIRYQLVGYICEYERPTMTPLIISTPIDTETTVERTRETNDLTVLCPRNHFVYGQSCYEFVEDPDTYNWTYAVKSCRARGGQLVSLETEEENDAIIEGLKPNFLYKELFIGLRRPEQGITLWISGAPLTYSRIGDTTSNFKCTTVFAFHSTWFPRPCDPGVPVGSGYICEYSRETMPSADVTPSPNNTLSSVTSGRDDSTTYVTSARVEHDDDKSLKIGVLISVVLVLLILVIAAIVFALKRRKIGKHSIAKGKKTNKEFKKDTDEVATQHGPDEIPVYMQLQTPDIIRETPNPVGSIRLEINIQPNYESVEGGSYYEIRKLNSTETDTDPITKERFISRNISRAKTVFRMSGRKRFADQKEGKEDIKSNRPQSCKAHYIAGQERAFYAHSNLGFSSSTCTLPNQRKCSIENEHFYNKPIYDVCGPAQAGEQIYSLPCPDTLASNSTKTSPKDIDSETQHYYSSMTDPPISNKSQQGNTSAGAVYFVLEKPEEETENNGLSNEVENEIYERGP